MARKRGKKSPSRRSGRKNDARTADKRPIVLCEYCRESAKTYLNVKTGVVARLCEEHVNDDWERVSA